MDVPEHKNKTPSAPPLPDDIKAMSFEQAMAELEAITRKTESGQGTLDEAIAAYERGTLLRRHCAAKLDEAEAKIERVTRNDDGTLSTQPTEIG